MLNEMIEMIMMTIRGRDREDIPEIEDQLDLLRTKLDDEKIPYVYGTNPAGNRQIIYPDEGTFTCSVVSGPYTHGGKKGYIEIMGLLTSDEETHDNVAGWLTAEDVFQRIKGHLNLTKGQKD